MNASVMKPNSPYVTRKALRRTPASAESRKRAAFIDSHDFSVIIDKTTKQAKISVTKKM